MSTNTELTFTTSEVVPAEPTTITTTQHTDITTEGQTSVVEGRKKEYSIVGDGLYASVSANEAPTWLTGLIDSVVSTSIASGMTDYDSLVQDVQSAIDSIAVASNTYVTQVDVTPLVDGIVTSRLDTLNATTATTYATKVELSTAVATSESAIAQDINNLSVSLNNTINSQISTVQTSLATQTGALASDIAALEAAYVDQESGLAAAASAVSGLQTYVGLDPAGAPNGTGLIDSVQSLSAFYVDLENEVTGADGYVNTALTSLQVTSEAYTDAVESKFEYGSTIKLANGSYYNAGFGLKTIGTSGTGTELNPYNSEFWVNADKFKFTNSTQTTEIAPFTIDGTGVRITGTFSNNKNSYLDPSNGWWLGVDSGLVKMNLGNSTEYLKWDGTTLLMNNAFSRALAKIAITEFTVGTYITGNWGVMSQVPSTGRVVARSLSVPSTYAVSDDGITFTEVTPVNPPVTAVLSSGVAQMAAIGGKVVTGGKYSSDGVSWTSCVVDTGSLPNQLSNSTERVFAVSAGGGSVNFYSSIDGISFVKDAQYNTHDTISVGGLVKPLPINLAAFGPADVALVMTDYVLLPTAGGWGSFSKSFPALAGGSIVDAAYSPVSDMILAITDTGWLRITVTDNASGWGNPGVDYDVYGGSGSGYVEFDFTTVTKVIWVDYLAKFVLVGDGVVYTTSDGRLFNRSEAVPSNLLREVIFDDYRDKVIVGGSGLTLASVL